MKAMILAAGLGTRLRPLTDNRPKALVELSGRTLLEITLSRLRTFGITEVIINVHHFADLVTDYLKSNNNFGMRLEDSARLEEPFLLHNVDVISTIDLRRMLQFHSESHALATLAVQDRGTSRYLLFNDHLQLCGRRAGPGLTSGPTPSQRPDQKPEIVRPSVRLQPLGFSGIHVISPRLLPMLTEEGVFSIIPSYLRLAAQGENILAFRAEEYYWRDLGRPADLTQATHDLQQKALL